VWLETEEALFAIRPANYVRKIPDRQSRRRSLSGHMCMQGSLGSKPSSRFIPSRTAKAHATHGGEQRRAKRKARCKRKRASIIWTSRSDQRRGKSPTADECIPD